MMKYRVAKLFSLVAGAVALLSSCVKEAESLDYSVTEQIIFDKWMAENKPELVDNFQSNGGYYIDLQSQGDTQAQKISEEACWVTYEFTGYDLVGNVCLTRSDVVAWQQGSFSKNTHYVPYFRLSGEGSFAILEGTELAFTSELKIGEEQVSLYDGAEFTIYMPSSLVGGDGLAGDGGYEGQYSLSSGRPLVAKIKVLSVDPNPLETEGEVIDAFATANGGVTISAESKADDDNAWSNVVDTLAHLYVNPTFEPSADKAAFNYENPYFTEVPESPYYGGVAELDKKINEALIERFGKSDVEGEEVGEEGTMKIWYIGRFLDGFIFDTNIDEVKKLVYGEVATEGEALSFDLASETNDYIAAWNYTLPTLKYGQWSSLVTISSFAYGATGQAGKTNTSTSGGSSNSSSYYDYYNMYNYYNSYYGGGYYDNYYNGYYNNYYNNYYNPYYDNMYNTTTTPTVTTTTISTEIPAYTPLIFEIYVEPADVE